MKIRIDKEFNWVLDGGTFLFTQAEIQLNSIQHGKFSNVMNTGEIQSCSNIAGSPALHCLDNIIYLHILLAYSEFGL